MRKTKTSTKTSNFKYVAVAPNVRQVTPKTYQARAFYKGKRFSVTTTSKLKALAWVKQVRNTGNTALPLKSK